MGARTKGCYVDTSLIIARYKPTDVLYKNAEAMFKKSELKLYVSPITLIELYSILSRISSELDLPITKGALIDALVTFIIMDCRLTVASETRAIEDMIAGQSYRSTLEYHTLMRFAEKLKLRTLDLLHLSYAWLLKRKMGIDVFVTGDEELLEKSKDIKDTLGVRTLHPRMV